MDEALAEKKRVVKAPGMDGSLLAASPILFNAPLVSEVNLTIPLEAARIPTLFERIQYMLKPLLSGLSMEELKEDEKHQDSSIFFPPHPHPVRCKARQRGLPGICYRG